MSESSGLLGESMLVRAWATALRPAHWVKNVLVAAPMVFGHATPTSALLLSLAAAFVICSLSASAGYLVNDVLDRGADRQHASKRLRPIASGVVDPALALGVAGTLALSALLLALLLFGPAMLALVVAYLTLTVVYSRWLKRLPVIDVCALAVLFTLRLLVGGVASEIEVSAWLLAFGGSLFLSLALAKRLDEVVASDRVDGHAVPGRAYGRTDIGALRRGALLCAAAAIGVLVAYISLRGGDIYLYRNPEWLWVSTALLALWLVHMLRRAAAGRLRGDPVVVATTDPTSLVLALAVAATLTAAV